MKRSEVTDAVRRITEEGLLEPDRAERVAARLQELLVPKEAESVDASSRIARLIAWLGGLLVAAGILTLIGLNWEHFGKWLKLFLTFGGLFGLHMAGWRLQQPGSRHGGVGLALSGAACLSFGGAIALVAQIYHLESHWPNALLAWWLLDLPFVFIFGSRALLLVVTALFAVWGLWNVDVWCNDHRLWRFFDHDALAWGYASLGLGAIVAAAGALARGSRHERFAPLLGGLGKLGALASLFLLSFHDFMHDRSASDGSFLGPERLGHLRMLLAPAAVYGAAALALLAVAAWLHRGWREHRDRRREPLDVALILGGGLVVVLFDFVFPPAAFLAANAALAFLVLALIVRGVRAGQVGDVNLALAAALVTILARYFEFFTEGFEPAFTFLGAGVLLLALGYFIERLRRDFVARARRSQS